ncbi:MAG: Ca-activated chloride channel family protein [Flavobacteriales bacterium]|jgi:Ca-activated chloride channel family protein
MAFGKRRTPKHLIIDDYPDYPKPSKHHPLRWAIALSVVLIVIVLSARGHADTHSRTDTRTDTRTDAYSDAYAHTDVDKQNQASADLVFITDSGQHLSATHLNSSAQVEINGMLAHIELSQRFKNTSSQWQQAEYVFPLPEDAAVHAMEMHIGERVIIGEIHEKEKAAKIYQQALKAGKKAALTEQKRANIFKQSIANIAPGEEIEIRIQYQHPVKYDMGVFSWRIPTTITPRYQPLQANDIRQRFSQNQNMSVDDDVNPDFNPDTRPATKPDRMSVQTPVSDTHNASHNFELNIHLNSGLPLASIQSPYHTISIDKRQDEHWITLVKQQEKMNRDFVLRWSPVMGQAPQAAIFSEIKNDQHYAMLMLIPPMSVTDSASTGASGTKPSATNTSATNSAAVAQHVNTERYSQQGANRDIIYVIDTSGSMAGESIEQARKSLRLALTRLKPGDRFNIIEFNSKHFSVFSHLKDANRKNIEHAKTWVDGLKARGGTEMLSALKASLTGFDNGQLEQIVFITDGAIANESQLFSNIHQDLGDKRLFTVGIGAAPNSYFMRKAAQFGRGTHTHIAKLEEIPEKMDALFLKLESTVANHIRIDWGSESAQYPQNIGDLYLGEPLLVTAQFTTSPREIHIEGYTDGKAWKQTIDFKPKSQSTGLSRIWARAKIESLEDKKIAGMDADEAREKIITVALEHQLLSAYTSFVAVDKSPSRNISDALLNDTIPQQRAKGSKAAKVHYPKTATTAQISGWLGCFVFILSIFIWRMRDEEL